MPQILEREVQPPSRFVSPILDYESPSSKVEGFKQLLEFDLHAPSPMFILTHEAFLEYQERGLTPELEQEISSAYDAIRFANPNRGAYVGRAVYVPGIDNPKGPRSAAIYKKEQFIQQVVDTWKYVQENDYMVEGSDIALVLHPFISVMDHRTHYGDLPLSEGELSWSGGYVVPAPEPGKEHQIQIKAAFGTDEAIQSCPSDEIFVDLDRKTVTKKIIVLKDRTFLPLSGDKYQPAKVPKSFQLEQALTDEEALAVAAEAKKVYTKRRNARLEFIVQPDGVYIREIAPWKPKNERDLLKLEKGEEFIGNVVRVESLSDIEKITGQDVIVYFGPGAFQLRSSDVFQKVASLPGVKRVFGLLYGSLITSHPARALVDSGHSVVHMSDREFQDGDHIRIRKGPNGEPMVELLDSYAHAVVPLSDYRRLQRGEAGPKAASLSRMLYHEIPVPDGFALTTEAMWRFLSDIELMGEIQRLDTVSLRNQKHLVSLVERVQGKIYQAPVPEPLLHQLEEALGRYPFTSYAVRSSGNEDGDVSLAGLYVSSRDVKKDAIVQSIRRTLASYFSVTSIEKLRNLGFIPSKMSLGVIIHEYIPTEEAVGAVVFTYPDSILIEAAPGSPDPLVSHRAKHYIKIELPRDGSKSPEITPFGNPSLTVRQEQIDEVVSLIERIERLSQRFQDVELIISNERGIVILQARPR